MAQIQSFEDIQVWRKGAVLAKAVYRECRTLSDFGFREQLQRAAVSITNNIAEGFERRGNKELRQFLYIAKGSRAEVRSMLYVGVELGYLHKDTFEKLKNDTLEISRMLSGFIKTL